MDYLVQFQLNVFALVALVILYAIIKMRSKIETFSKKMLKALMLTSGIAMILEPLTWIFDGMLFPGAYFLEYSTNFFLFLIGPVLGGLMLSYVDYHIFKDPKRIYKKGFYQHLSVLTFAVLIVNLAYPVYFQVDPLSNKFSSGDFKDIHYVVLASLYLYMIFFLLKNHKKTHTYIINIFIGFFTLPIVGMIVQLFDSKLYFSWTSGVLAILVAYIFLESTTAEEDFLTKLYNRHSYEVYQKHLIEAGKPFGIMLIDLNYFKEINDEHGHQRGDQVLIGFSQTLKKSFDQKGLIARLGGDEFIIVFEGGQKNPDEIAGKIDRLLRKHEDPLIKQLSFSYGCEFYHHHQSADQMYTTADEKMYQYKRTSKSMQQQSEMI
ncbi:diguanylate cyclase domain protein [Jeotgalibacillus alimentarius]|uniref:Diguanylate cyclase domain protein n=1 Tax=Jeotgalibacillus alimentarius TaxID=135826 RepID=A0A0C2RKH6_9BACL|nr:GGDEF domain-containing protein [Jeotgalibacillus alimentarius]KIL50705.1 diguanylate cyclase domain protein [Jeotgalibacillus alimentarius]